MAVVLRVVLCLTAFLIISYREIEAKPFLTDLYCLFCDDDDDDYYSDSSTSTTTSLEDLFDMDFCSSCRPNRRRTTTSTTANPLQSPQGFNVNIPPSPVGLNISMQNNGGSWLMNLMPWTLGGLMPSPATPTPPAGAPAAAPAAPAATTAAPAANATDAAAAPAAPAA